MNKKLKLLLLLLIMFLPLVRFVKAESTYPVLVWDCEPPTFVGTQFYVAFTCFSDSNDSIDVVITLDNIDIEWQASKPYFVNENISISTSDQLPGTFHKLSIKATDHLNRTNELTTFMTIDSIKPVFNYLELYPNDNGKYIINQYTPLTINWSITEENFEFFKIFRDEAEFIMATEELSGTQELIFFSLESRVYTITCQAIDLAQNIESRTFEIKYVVEEGGFIPKSEVDEMLREQKWMRNMMIVGIPIFVIMLLTVFIICLKPGGKYKGGKHI